MRRTAVPLTLLALGSFALTGCGPESTATSSASAAPAGVEGAKTEVAAGDSLMPFAVGNTWKYRTTMPGLGKGTTTRTVLSVTPTGTGERTVVMKYVSELPKLPRTTVEQTYVVRRNGSLEVPLTSVGADTKITVKSGSVLWPGAKALASGELQRSKVVLEMDLGGKKNTVPVSVAVRGRGTSKVTVPAGDYEALLIDQQMAQTIAGQSVKTVLKAWLVQDVGIVKTSVAVSGGGGAITEELVSFTKG